MSQPLVTIVIPVFNGANYLAEAIESALAQTYPNVEVLVVDDGSTDDGATRAVAEMYGTRIRYLHQRNGGVGSALNLGIEQMRGSLFSWLSHDDIYRPEKIAAQVDTWRRFSRPCIVIGDFETMDEQRSTIEVTSIRGRNLVARPLDAVFNGLINGCALLVPRELFEVAGVFEPGLPTSQDYHLWYRMARRVPLVHCARADVRQRIHPLQGSRHPSHLEEASRMFAHLVDSTPPEVMGAYEGSELRFLQKLKHTLAAYPGLQAYLQTRIERLLREQRFAVVLAADGPPETWAGSLEALRRLEPAALELVAIDRDAADAASGLPAGDSQAIVPAGTRIADVLRAVEAATSTGIVAFAHPARPPSSMQLRAALAAFFRADAVFVRPRGLPSQLSLLEGLLIRRTALPRLGAALDTAEAEWAQLGRAFRIDEYEPIDPPPADPDADLVRAFQGGLRMAHDRSLSETALAQTLAGLLEPSLPSLLFLSHSIGGGTQTHLDALAAELTGKANVLVGYGAPGGLLRLALARGGCGGGFVFRIPGQLSDLVRLLRRIGLVRVDVQHTQGFEEAAAMLLEALALPFDVSLLDYHLLANDAHLCLPNGRFAGDERLRDPEASLLRPEPLPMLRQAERVIAISRDLAARTEALCPGLPLVCAQSCSNPQLGGRHVFLPRLWGGEELRILVVGAAGPHKGSQLVAGAARLAQLRHLPLRFHTMGDLAASDAALVDTGNALVRHGRFETARFGEVLGGIAPHVGWLPNLAPETWSYVLSELMAASLPVAAHALGAIRERCHGRPATWLLPWTSTAEEWVEFFLRLHATGLRLPPRWAAVDELPPARPFFFDEYLRPARAAYAAQGAAGIAG